MTLFYKLSVLMGVVVVASNYLVQFPIQYFGLNEILTYGAFSYPVTFLITDLANRAYGKLTARKVVYVGFTIGVILKLFVFLKREYFNFNFPKNNLAKSKWWLKDNKAPPPVSFFT